MKLSRSPIAQTRRDAWTEINLSHVEFNIRELKKILNPDVQIMAVVKADAYGHGATMVSKTLSASGVNMFGVAAIDEGIQLRTSDIRKPILILGSTPMWALPSTLDYNLEITIFSDSQLNDCIQTAQKLNREVIVHVKVDTGMHRIGIDYRNALGFIEKVQSAKGVKLKGVFSHLASAEDPETSKIQIERWNTVLAGLKNKPPYLHFGNTSGIIAYKNIHYNLVRSGIELYGMKPDLPDGIESPLMKQVLSLKGRITHLHTADRGEGVSYGHKYSIDKEHAVIATVPIGYADGVSRNLSNKIYGLINGYKVPQIGSITMDQMMFNVTGISNIHPGDIITLLGYDNDMFISINDWANILGTINYEISCLLKVRLPRVYTSN